MTLLNCRLLSVLLVVTLVFLACNTNQAKLTTGSMTADSGSIPDTSRRVTDSLNKASVLTDTSWSQAVKTVSTPQKDHSLTKSGSTGKPGPNIIEAEKDNNQLTANPKPKLTPTMMDPFRPQELKDGLKKAQDGDLKGAIVDFTAALKKNPKNYNAYFYRAKARIESGDAAGAMEDINLAIENKGNEAIYFYYRGKMYSDAGKPDKAIQDFTSAIRWKHDFPDAWNYRGVARAKLGMHKEAITDYDSAIVYNPSYVLTFYNKGTSEATIGNYKAAVLSFTTAITLSPNHIQSYLNRGNCYVELKEFSTAFNDFTKAITLDPKNTDAYFNRGAAHFLAGDNQMCPDWKKAASLGNAKAKTMVEKYCK